MGWFGKSEKEEKADVDKKNRDAGHKYNKDMWKFTNKQNERLYDHQKETIKIQKKNDKQNINYQNDTNSLQHSNQVASQEY